MLRIVLSGRSGSTVQDIKRDLSSEQLAGIGAVAIAWNEIEFMLDVALYSGEELEASCLQDDLPRRRLDDKIRHARKAADRWRLPADYLKSIELTACAFSDLKDLRNAVVHSRVFDTQHGIGHRITAKGKVQEILLTTKALEWLYQQLIALCFELRCILAIFDLVRTAELAEQAGIVALGEIGSLPAVRSWLAKLNQMHRDRENLGPAPSFPQVADCNSAQGMSATG